MSRGHIDTRFLAAAWLLAAGIGLLASADHVSRPGADAGAPERWPENATLKRDPSRSVLLLFLHPHCPCSAASLYELQRLTRDAPGRLVPVVVFVQPAGVSGSWSRSKLWADAVANKDLQVIIDPDGVLARRFAVQTSGQGLLYGSRGTLQFSGGITPGRGHVGDSPGRTQILKLLNDGEPIGPPARCAVFGCALAGDHRRMQVSP